MTKHRLTDVETRASEDSDDLQPKVVDNTFTGEIRRVSRDVWKL